jgi:Zn2+/Cd2+-exporting ATPase
MKKQVTIPLGSRRQDPFVFRTFFEMGLEESSSPFLNPSAKRLARHMALKASLFSAFLLIAAWLIHPAALSELLLVAVFVIAGAPSLINSIEDVVFRKDVNIDVLTTIAAFSAYFLDAGFEGALLLILFAISGSLESLVTLKAKNALGLIHNLAPTKAYIVDEKGHTKERAVQDIPIGAQVFVKQGEQVPLDGIIVEGMATLSFAHLTGESRPIQKKEGEEVQAGARVIEGALTVKVIRTSSDSAVSQIVKLITKAQEAKPKLERWFDRLGRVYAISIITLSITSAFFFYFVLRLPLLGQEGAVYRALAFLIAASPCALILAVPIAYLSSLASCAKKGIVLKGGVVLDAIASCEQVAFDKTGTLTLGELEFSSLLRIVDDPSLSDDELIAIAATLERNAVHPIARAIEERGRKHSLFRLLESKVIPGQGVHGKIKLSKREITAFVGDARVEDAPDSVKKKALEYQEAGKIVAALRVADAWFLCTFDDKLRKRVPKMLERLKENGKKVIMLTGDSLENAARIARQVGIDEFHANLKPEEKLKKISALSRQGGLAMCGDGINDAPALARATVGISMGKMGSQTAKDASDCILLQDALEVLDWLFDKAMMTRKVVRQNVTIASLAILVASFGALYGFVPLWLAVILHEGGTVLVGLNAIRLLRQ